jgi:hypothetical protein
MTMTMAIPRHSVTGDPTPRQALIFTHEGMARLRAAGSENYKKGLAKRTPDERRKWARDAGLKAAEKATPEFFQRRGKRVAQAVQKAWTLCAPNGVSHSFTNLREFVRTNPLLFSDYELTPLGDGKPRAINGLHSLRPSDTRKRVSGSWRGWTWRLPPGPSPVQSVPLLCPSTSATEVEARAGIEPARRE